MKLSISKLLTSLICLSVFCGIFIIPYANTYIQVLLLDVLCIISMRGLIIIPQLSKSWIALICVLTLSSLFGISIAESLKYVLLIGSVILFAFYIINTNNSNHFKKMFVSLCVVETCFIVIQYIAPGVVDQINSVLLSTEQYNDVQTYYRLHKACVGLSATQPFAMFFSYCVFAYGVERSIQKVRLWNLFLAIIGIIGIFFAGKRSGIIVLIITLIILFLFSFERRKGIPKFWKYFIAFLAVAGIYLLLYTPMGTGILEKNTVLSSAGDVTNGRSILYAKMISVFLENPVLGIGPLATMEYSGEYLGHNIYLQYLCESGLIGFICLIWLMAGNLVKTIKCINRIQIGQNTELYFLLLVQLFVVIYGFMGNPFYNIIFLIPYALFTTFVNCRLAQV